MKKAAIFDMDGTLVANSPIHIRAFEIFCARYDVTDWREKLANGFGMGNDDIMRLVMSEEVIREKGLAALADEKEAIYREIYAPDIRPVEGLKELLERLRAAGIPCAVGSSGCKANVDFVLDSCAIRPYFDAAISGDMVSRCKPDPEIYLTAAAALGVSPLMACMVMGAVYINVSDDDRLFKQLNYFSPPFLLVFFVRSGMSFRLDTLFDASARVAGVPLLLIGCLYFFVRILGKYLGAFLGCKICKKPNRTTNTLGLALIPQAGVAIGLAELAARTIGGETGIIIQTVIMSSSILYELIGPAMAKLALVLSGSIGGGESLPIKEPGQSRRDELIERMNAIQAEIDRENYARSEEEKAFSAAAEEDIPEYAPRDRNRKFINRR